MIDVEVVDRALTGELAILIDGRPTRFRLRSDFVEAAAVRELDPAAKDFLEIAATVFHADGELRRGGQTRPEMGRGWYRDLRFTIPVRQLDIWGTPQANAALTELVQFLTGDHVEFRFTQRRNEALQNGFLDLDPEGPAFRAEEIILFSGGLDSFAGTLEALSLRSGKIVLVSHSSAPQVSHRQLELADWLASKFGQRFRHVKVPATHMDEEAPESTQRSRSLLFAAIGHAVAISFGASKLNFYENGIVSHNLPISRQVVSTMATRTTHPLSLTLMNRLIALISPDSTRIANPYQWMTKTEVVEQIERHGGTAMIGTAVSCTRVRGMPSQGTHCGSCSQCLDRRFAILAAGLETYDPAEHYKTDVLFGQRDDGENRTMAVEWTRHALGLAQLQELGFVKAFGLEVTRSLQGHPGEDPQEMLGRIHSLHRRHGNQVDRVLTRIVAERSRDIVAHRLEQSCLVQLWLSDGGSIGGAASLGAGQPNAAIALTERATETDLVLRPEGPFIARFRFEGGTPIVEVDGLCVIRAKTADIPHRLKDCFLEDEANLSEREHFRFFHLGHLPGPPLNKPAARQEIKRCRDQLAEAYEAIFHSQPQMPLLIENRRNAGYRLSPSTVVIDSPKRPPESGHHRDVTSSP